MEKHILRWSYWLGIASLVIAVVWRALNGLGLGSPMLLIRGESIYSMSFYKASLLLFVAAIATANYGSSKWQRP
jgi:hypothetical protein